MSYVNAGYTIALGILFLYAVALVLRRRRWERALRVIERVEPAGGPEVAERSQAAERIGPAPHVERAAHAEEQAAPGARS
jgi:uncharacterized protein (TIGR03382 family)